MEEGQKNALTELSEDSRAKISHNPQTRPAERIKYSADDILDETKSGDKSSILTNVKAPDPDFESELAKTRETLSRNPIIRAFDKSHRIVTWSVICAICFGFALLIFPTLLQKAAEYDPKAINPDTGLTNEETRWNNFTNNIRSTVYDLSSDDSADSEAAVIDYFNQLLEDYTGVADEMDIRSIWAEYYINLGKPESALDVLLAADTNYDQPADNDPDLPSYFERVAHYYRLLRDTYSALGEEAQAASVQRTYDAILDEKIRTSNLNIPTTEELNSAENE